MSRHETEPVLTSIETYQIAMRKLRKSGLLGDIFRLQEKFPSLYSDLTYSIKMDENNAPVNGLYVELSWNRNIENTEHRTTKIKVNPTGLIYFGWHTQTLFGKSWISEKNNDYPSEKIYHRLKRLLKHSPLMSKI